MKNPFALKKGSRRAENVTGLSFVLFMIFRSGSEKNESANVKKTFIDFKDTF